MINRFPNFHPSLTNVPESAVPCEQLFSSAGYIVNKTRSSFDATTVNMLVCLRRWLSDNIWVRKRVCYSLLLT